MTLLEIHADLEQLTFQVKRIADLLEEYVHPPRPTFTPYASKAELHVVQPRSRWEAEQEERRYRGVSDGEAGVMPRR